MATNPELELAFDYVSQTNRHLYLTGKAGTGKTTFLHRIKAEVPKRMAVVAPTGVAAINAKGVTIHSLFQLPFGVLMPGDATSRSRQFSAKKRDLIRGLDLLVIDEISMVRADVLDGIDEVLRRLRRSNEPFGGIQLLMIGDLHQLPPVVRDEEWNTMRGHYETAYFFGSKALKNARPATVQLKHIYRQQDEAFIGLLNRVRNNKMDKEVFDALNQRYQPDFKPGDNDGYITLTSHNNAARQINDEKLRKLAGKSYAFRADIVRKFPESMYPNTEKLEFKIGAQVMFNKNDTATQLYFNGKIGKITAINGERIKVECPGDSNPIYVEPVTWENRKIELNPETKVVEDHIIGEYTQHPLKLAWAITIHKSQGLTFDKVVIDAADAFAHGQVYVALSRCKTFEGIVLRSRIGDRSVRTDAVVNDYSENARDNQPTPEDLLADKRKFQLDCLRQLFTGSNLHGAASRLNRALLENERYLSGSATVDYTPVHGTLANKVLAVGKKFVPHINKYGLAEELPEANVELRERLAGAADYFIKQLDPISTAVEELDIISDNKKILDTTRDRHLEMRRELFVADKLFRIIKAGYEPLAFVRARADAAMDFDRATGKTTKKKAPKTPKDLDHPELYRRLHKWRGEFAEREDTQPSKILASGSLLEIDKVLPTVKKSLLRIKSYGAKRYESSGKEILAIINDYLEGKGLITDNLAHAQGAKAKEDTKMISFQLQQQGKSIAEIAAARKMAESTIEGHLAYWIGLGELPATDLMEQADLDAIITRQEAAPEEGFTEAVKHFDGKYNYGQLRIAKAHALFIEVVSTD